MQASNVRSKLMNIQVCLKHKSYYDIENELYSRVSKEEKLCLRWRQC